MAALIEPKLGIGAPTLLTEYPAREAALSRPAPRDARFGERFEPPTILRRLVAQGRLGTKSGQGFYAYPQPDAEQPDEQRDHQRDRDEEQGAGDPEGAGHTPGDIGRGGAETAATSARAPRLPRPTRGWWH